MIVNCRWCPETWMWNACVWSANWYKRLFPRKYQQQSCWEHYRARKTHFSRGRKVGHFMTIFICSEFLVSDENTMLYLGDLFFKKYSEESNLIGRQLASTYVKKFSNLWVEIKLELNNINLDYILKVWVRI